MGVVQPTCLSANAFQVQQVRQGGTLLVVGFGNKSANLQTQGKAYYPSMIIMQTDRRQVGRVDKNVSLRDVMS